jgi:hypothetical protein
MRSNHTDPGQDTRADEGWNPDLDGHRLQSDADVTDRVEQQGRLRRAGSASGMTGTTWQDIKSRFVDDPKGAIAAAEQLVQQSVEARVRALKEEAAAICARDRETEDNRDDEGSTEALRTRLIRYQQYCERLAGSEVL